MADALDWMMSAMACVKMDPILIKPKTSDNAQDNRQSNKRSSIQPSWQPKQVIPTNLGHIQQRSFIFFHFPLC